MKEHNLTGGIWPDFMLHDWAKDGGVDPFDPALVNPASLDLRLGREYIDIHTGDRGYLPVAPDDGFVLKPGMAILATTLEYVCMPVEASGTIYLKSSAARKGLDHALAGWIDPGFFGEITLELHAHRSIQIHAGMRICQLVLNGMAAYPEKDYRQTGRYNGQRGPTPARERKPDEENRQ